MQSSYKSHVSFLLFCFSLGFFLLEKAGKLSSACLGKVRKTEKARHASNTRKGKTRVRKRWERERERRDHQEGNK